MTTTPSEPAATDEPLLDPHAPKLSPDDPRLSLGRPRARTLRAGPIAALLGVAWRRRRARRSRWPFSLRAPRRKASAEPSAAPPPPVVPDTIRNAQPSRAALAAAVDAGLGERAFRPAPAEDPESPRRAGDRPQGTRRGNPLRIGPRRRRRIVPRPRSPLAPLRRSRRRPARRPPSAALDPNLQEHKNAFLERPGRASPPPTTSRSPSQHPRSPYEIKAGTVLPAVLITAINSDLPGPVVAQVREHVYDTVTGDHLLVPQGSRLIAQYDSMVAWGQERVLLCWNRLILPNGDSLDLQCMPAADLKGAAGLADEVDEHWWRILKGATVATLLSAGTAFAAGDTTSYNPSVGQVVARSGSGEIGQVGAQLTRSNLSIQPTITVRPGFSVNVVVTKDMILAPYPDPPAALGLRRE